MKKVISLILALAMVLTFGISALAEDESRSLNEVLGSAVSATLPMKADYTLGSEKLIDFGDHAAYGLAVKVSLEANEIIEMKFCGKNEGIDTIIEIYKKNGEAFERITDISGDNDNCNGDGEEMIFSADETRDYYITFAGYNYAETGECVLEIKSVAGKAGKPLDFTAETAPVPAAGDLWTWDAQDRVLTLKDGFDLTVVEYEPAIHLPGGATLIVEGKATVRGYNEDESAIECDGVLIIKGSGADKSVLNIVSYDDGIYADALLSIENIAVNIRARSEGTLSYGLSYITNAKLDVDAGSECIYVGNDPDYGAKLGIKNSDLDLYSEGEEGIDVSGELSITGGKLVVLADENALEAHKMTLTDVIFDLKTIDEDYTFIDIQEEWEGFSLPGTFRLYGIDGKQLYEGEWKDELLNEDGELYVGGTEVFAAASVVEEPEPEPEPKPVPEPKGDTVVIKIGAAAAEKGEANPNTGAEVVG